MLRSTGLGPLLNGSRRQFLLADSRPLSPPSFLMLGRHSQEKSSNEFISPYQMLSLHSLLKDVENLESEVVSMTQMEQITMAENGRHRAETGFSGGVGPISDIALAARNKAIFSRYAQDIRTELDFRSTTRQNMFMEVLGRRKRCLVEVTAEDVNKVELENEFVTIQDGSGGSMVTAPYLSVSNGKVYFELEVVEIPAKSQSMCGCMVGVSGDKFTGHDLWYSLGFSDYSFSVVPPPGDYRDKGSRQFPMENWVEPGRVIGIALDVDAGVLMTTHCAAKESDGGSEKPEWVVAFDSGPTPGPKVGGGLYPAWSGERGFVFRYNFGQNLEKCGMRLAPPTPEYIPWAASQGEIRSILLQDGKSEEVLDALKISRLCLLREFDEYIAKQLSSDDVLWYDQQTFNKSMDQFNSFNCGLNEKQHQVMKLLLDGGTPETLSSFAHADGLEFCDRKIQLEECNMSWRMVLSGGINFLSEITLPVELPAVEISILWNAIIKDMKGQLTQKSLMINELKIALDNFFPSLDVKKASLHAATYGHLILGFLIAAFQQETTILKEVNFIGHEFQGEVPRKLCELIGGEISKRAGLVVNGLKVDGNEDLNLKTSVALRGEEHEGQGLGERLDLLDWWFVIGEVARAGWRTLNLSDNDLCSANPEMFLALRLTKNLTSLDLSNNRLGSDAGRTLAQVLANLPNLVSLNLSDNYLEIDNWNSIVNCISGSSRLAKLNDWPCKDLFDGSLVEFTGPTGAFGTALLHLVERSASSLKSLDLSSNASALERGRLFPSLLKVFTNLRELDLGTCIDLREASINVLKEIITTVSVLQFRRDIVYTSRQWVGSVNEAGAVMSRIGGEDDSMLLCGLDQGGEKICSSENRCWNCRLGQGRFRLPCPDMTLHGGESKLAHLFTLMKGARSLTSLDIRQDINYYLRLSAGSLHLGHVLPSLINLQSFQLWDLPLSPEDAEALASGAAAIPSFTSFRLRGNELGVNGLKRVMMALRSRNLLCLQISNNQLENEGGLLLASELQFQNSLDTLIIDNNNFGTAAVRAILHSARDKPLRLLDASGNCIKVAEAPEFAKELGSLSGLTSLSLGSNQLEGSGDVIAQVIRSMPNLRTSSFSLGGLGLEDWAKIVAESGKNLALESLDGCRFRSVVDGAGSTQPSGSIDPGLFISLLASWPTFGDSLTAIEFGSDCVFGDSAVVALAAAVKRTLPKIRSLSLRDCGIKDGGGTSLAGMLSFLPGIHNLVLSGNEVGPAASILICKALGNLTEIQSLELRKIMIGDEGVTSLAGVLGSITNLKNLDISDNKCSSAAVAALVPTLSTLAALESINLWPCERLADDWKTLAPALLALPCLSMVNEDPEVMGLRAESGLEELRHSVGATPILAQLLPRQADSLLKLELSCMKVDGAELLGKAIARLTCLQDLALCSPEEKSISSLLPAVGCFSSLKMLRISNALLDAEDRKALAGCLASGLPSLTSFDFWTQQPNMLAAFIPAAGCLSALKSLKLSYSLVDPEDAKVLAGWLPGGVPSLTNLSFSCNQLGDEGAETVVRALTGLTSLTCLDLWGNNVSEECAGRLPAMLPWLGPWESKEDASDSSYYVGLQVL